MKVDILTREYPPHVYGGAGVHAEELSKVLAERIDDFFLARGTFALRRRLGIGGG